VKKAQGGVSLGDELIKAIRNKTARIVVIGLGYVGLPVACMFARAGFQVVGIRRAG
jgi:UDP-N-acetyl-D-glucosamine dehydrogenase